MIHDRAHTHRDTRYNNNYTTHVWDILITKIHVQSNFAIFPRCKDAGDGHNIERCGWKEKQEVNAASMSA